MTKNIAIIGAGLTGLTLAESMKDYATISLFEKARGVAGRMSTRYADEYRFDHGAQFFTARSKGFKHFLQPFIEQRVVQEWTPKVMTLEHGKKYYKRDWFEPHYSGSPNMNSLCRAIATSHNVNLRTQIERLSQEAHGWYLIDSENLSHGPFDWVISTAPSPQAANLMPSEFSGHALIANTKMQGCYSLMLGFNHDLALNWQAAKVKNSPIEWISVNSSKPDRNPDYSLLVQTTNQWSEAHLEDEQGQVREVLLTELEKLLGRDMHDAAYQSLHRWRYANTLIDQNAEKGDGFFIDEKLQLGVCGDWCLQGQVESAFLSAHYLAESLKSKL
ncbi:NAD(P)-binding protein [Aliiglaciecola sp. LCG003]|uniref:NAD(P)/FAD-dependent oxidoreductase n=1 Tax=Aliiglaciecola sp. LCG003 TaxID=3053655 RepID=UPI00257454AD|nr:NAD(P)-binding protein [Aliiglaciecola sp. LCG003]WJG10759.1 NAD(P)-binding protein [Aliiglaciecola sp. LCG003]